MYKYSLVNNSISDINNEPSNLMNELKLYKNIVMDPNKNPETYLEYIKSRVPTNYNIEIKNLKEFNKFPLTKAVGDGSSYNTYFVHIKPNIESNDKKTIYLVGKSVTYDSGGLNIKTRDMHEMKTDMAGSAIIISVLNILAFSNYDNNYNIHLLIPVVENMIGNTAIRPGQVIKSYNSKLVEITDTDAEGRLCLADCLEYINKDLLINKNLNNCLIIDIATLTGSAVAITSEIASITMCNEKGEEYKNKLIQVGENVGEYLEYLKLRPEYLDFLKSKVADIKNLNHDVKAGCIVGGTFLNYFTTENCPWIHLDIAPNAYIKEVSMSYGVNLLVEFIKQL
jgi:leucyl aminopeptidase